MCVNLYSACIYLYERYRVDQAVRWMRARASPPGAMAAEVAPPHASPPDGR
jgi:hypothetical protein